MKYFLDAQASLVAELRFSDERRSFLKMFIADFWHIMAINLSKNAYMSACPTKSKIDLSKTRGEGGGKDRFDISKSLSIFRRKSFAKERLKNVKIWNLA